jgi:hypothetical protein
MPVAGSIERPAGKPVALKVSVSPSTSSKKGETLAE